MAYLNENLLWKQEANENDYGDIPCIPDVEETVSDDIESHYQVQCCVWSGITHFARSAEKERPFRLLHS